MHSSIRTIRSEFLSLFTLIVRYNEKVIIIGARRIEFTESSILEDASYSTSIPKSMSDQRRGFLIFAFQRFSMIFFLLVYAQ